MAVQPYMNTETRLWLIKADSGEPIYLHAWLEKLRWEGQWDGQIATAVVVANYASEDPLEPIEPGDTLELRLTVDGMARPTDYEKSLPLLAIRDIGDFLYEFGGMASRPEDVRIIKVMLACKGTLEFIRSGLPGANGEKE